jgi:hypothetical protein
MKLPSFAEVRKAAAAAVGLVAQIVALGFLSGTALHYAQIIIAAATLLGVYIVPKNADPEPAAQHEA